MVKIRKRKIPVLYILFLALVLCVAAIIVSMLHRTTRNLTEMAVSGGEGIQEGQIFTTDDYELQLLFSSYEFRAAMPHYSSARYYLEYAITNHSDKPLAWKPPHLEYLVEDTWYRADSARSLSASTLAFTELSEEARAALEQVTVTGPGTYGDTLFPEARAGDPIQPGEKRHDLIILDTITGESTDGSPEYTNVFWPGSYRLVYETGDDQYITMTFELQENAMDLSHQLLTDSWDGIYFEGDPSTITDQDLLLTDDVPTLHGVSYQEILLVSRGSSRCWEQEYRNPYRTYTFTFAGDIPAESPGSTARLEYLRNTEWYPIPADELPTLDPAAMAANAGNGYFSFTLYPAQNRSADVHTDTQKFRTGQYRLLLPMGEKGMHGTYVPVEFLLE